MSSEPRYFYVDAQNQAAGPVAMAALFALKSAGTVTDATLVAVEGGTEWAAFSTLKTNDAATPEPTPTTSSQPATGSQSLSSSVPTGVQGVGVANATAEPAWASQLSLKIDQLTATMDKLVVALDKARPAPAPVIAPATAALHAEKINLNPTPKPGIAAQNPFTSPGITPKPAGFSAPTPRPGVSTPLAPLAVPANAQKSTLPLPALGKSPSPTSATPTPDAAGKGNIFSKFLKK